jgi:xanthosine utilization system XapX-like protein
MECLIILGIIVGEKILGLECLIILGIIVGEKIPSLDRETAFLIIIEIVLGLD